MSGPRLCMKMNEFTSCTNTANLQIANCSAQQTGGIQNDLYVCLCTSQEANLACYAICNDDPQLVLQASLIRPQVSSACSFASVFAASTSSSASSTSSLTSITTSSSSTSTTTPLPSSSSSSSSRASSFTKSIQTVTSSSDQASAIAYESSTSNPFASSLPQIFFSGDDEILLSVTEFFIFSAVFSLFLVFSF